MANEIGPGQKETNSAPEGGEERGEERGEEGGGERGEERGEEGGEERGDGQHVRLVYSGLPVHEPETSGVTPPETVVYNPGRPSMPRPHQCETCKKSFSHLSVLKSHRKIHTGEKSYKCVLCHKIFAGRGSLTNHLIAHTGVKQFKCSHCGKEFMRKEHLQCHVRIHTGVRPYKCEVCHKGFATASHRKVHMRNHTGERPFACHLCPKRFICSSGLKTHMFSHTGERPHACQICHKTFAGGYLLRKHMKCHEKALTAQPEQSEPLDCSMSPCDEENLPPLPALQAIKSPGAQISTDNSSDGDSQIEFTIENQPADDDEEEDEEEEEEREERTSGLSCDFCRREFPSAILLRLHMVTSHASDRANLCEICLKAFPTVMALQFHKRREHAAPARPPSADNPAGTGTRTGTLPVLPTLILNTNPTIPSHPHANIRHTPDNNGHVQLVVTHGQNRRDAQKAGSVNSTDSRDSSASENIQSKLLCTECDEDFDDKEKYDGHRWLCLKMATDKLAIKIKQNRLGLRLLQQSGGEIGCFSFPGERGNHDPSEREKLCRDENIVAVFESFKLSVDRLVSSGHGKPMPGRRPSHPPPALSEGHRGDPGQQQRPDPASSPTGDVITCDVCNKLFTSASRLRTHQAVHKTERPFKCEICAKTFKGRGSLHNHMMVHNVIKPFKCQICAKTFTRKEHLHIHIRLHTGDKPYSCNYCSKRFATASHMKVHVRNHTGEKPFSCELCDRKFTSSSLLKGHQKRDHKSDSPLTYQELNINVG